MTFKLKKPVRAMAYPVGRDAGFYARFNVKVSSSISGQYAERWSQIRDCDGHPVDEDVVADTSGCTSFTWTMTVDLKYNLNTQRGRFYTRGQGIPLYNQASVFDHWNTTCPFFKAGTFFNLPDDKGDSWDTHGQGILYRYAAVKGKRLLRPRGKTITISRTASRSFQLKGQDQDPNDSMTGETQTHWVVSLKPRLVARKWRGRCRGVRADADRPPAPNISSSMWRGRCRGVRADADRPPAPNISSSTMGRAGIEPATLGLRVPCSAN